MRAAVYHGPGDVRIETVDPPATLRPDHVRLRVRCAAICGTDCHEFVAGPKIIPLHERHASSGHVGPMVIGHEFVGVVDAVGAEVSTLVVGDRVVSGAGISCGNCDWCTEGRLNLCSSYHTLGLNLDGGLAEFVDTPASICVAVPDRLSDVAASMAQPLAVALHALNRGKVHAGTPVAIIGAGGIGSFAIAAARARGAQPVIAIDVDAARLATAVRLGADVIVNSATSGAIAAAHEATAGLGPAVVIEASGAPGTPQSALAMVRRGGTVVIVGLQKSPVPLDLFDLTMREIEMTSAMAHVCGAELPEAVAMLASSDVATVVLDRVIGLDDLVAHGFDALLNGTATGKVVIDISRDRR